MSKKNLFCLIIISLLACSCTRKVAIDESSTRKAAIDESRLVEINLDTNNVKPFDKEDSKKRAEAEEDLSKTLVTFDIYTDSVINIFNELKRNNFKLNNVGCYAARNIRNGKTKSLHAYASAIDVNSRQNPYINIWATPILIIPKPEDMQEEIKNKDYYLKRNIIRPGMITEKEAEIFYKNGFTQWGGSTVWRGCPDYMHFQTSLAIAKIVTQLPKYQARIFWNKYLQDPKKIILDPFFNQDIDDKDIEFKSVMKRIDKILKVNKQIL